MSVNPLLVKRVEEAVKQGLPVEELLDRDFIPGGKSVSLDDLYDIEETDHPLHRCCVSVSHDIQSGPIFCGKPATITAKVKGDPGGAVHCCPAHTPEKLQAEKERREADRKYGHWDYGWWR